MGESRVHGLIFPDFFTHLPEHYSYGVLYLSLQRVPSKILMKNELLQVFFYSYNEAETTVIIQVGKTWDSLSVCR